MQWLFFNSSSLTSYWFLVTIDPLKIELYFAPVLVINHFLNNFASQLHVYNEEAHQDK